MIRKGNTTHNATAMRMYNSSFMYKSMSVFHGIRNLALLISVVIRNEMSRKYFDVSLIHFSILRYLVSMIGSPWTRRILQRVNDYLRSVVSDGTSVLPAVSAPLFDLIGIQRTVQRVSPTISPVNKNCFTVKREAIFAYDLLHQVTNVFSWSINQPHYVSSK